jgi:hypothetical protein
VHDHTQRLADLRLDLEPLGVALGQLLGAVGLVTHLDAPALGRQAVVLSAQFGEASEGGGEAGAGNG